MVLPENMGFTSFIFRKKESRLRGKKKLVKVKKQAIWDRGIIKQLNKLI